MAGTVTISAPIYVPNVSPVDAKLVEYAINWTSDASGNANGTTFTPIPGILAGFLTDPIDGPTDNYDITLEDASGFDVLFGGGSDRDTTNTEQFFPVTLGSDGTTAMPFFVGGRALEFKVANAGDTKSGSAIVTIKL